MKKFFVIFSFTFALTAAIQAQTNVQFPIAELGGCTSKISCRSYCGETANIERCLDFAEKNGLMDREEISEAKKFLKIGSGPGGCTTKDECESYCDNVSHIRECIAFAEKNGFISGDELKEAQQIIRALDSGAKLPGGCTSERSCDTYCSNESNILECVAFAEAAGFITSEEASMAKKTGGKGPGGCRGKECKSYCENPQNAEVCYNFAKEYGLMSPEMEEGSLNFLDSLKNAPSEVKACMESTFGDLNKVFPGQKTGAKLRECYDIYSRENPGKAYWPAQGGEQQMTGPGGCRNREECDAYCLANPLECKPTEGQFVPTQDDRLKTPPADETQSAPPVQESSAEPVTYSFEASLASILSVLQQLIIR